MILRNETQKIAVKVGWLDIILRSKTQKIAVRETD